MVHKYLLGAAFALAALTAQADVLLIDSVEQEARASDARPERGMRMDTVESRFGTPVQRQGAVGEPPIARWEYQDFIVYFEHDRVIHAAARR